MRSSGSVRHLVLVLSLVVCSLLVLLPAHRAGATSPLIPLHTITVDQYPTGAFFDPTTRLVVIDGAPGLNHDAMTALGPERYTILAGATGVRRGVLVQSASIGNLLVAQDGTGALFVFSGPGLPSGQGLRPITASGRLGPAIGTTVQNLGGTFALDPQRNLLISINGGLSAYNLSTGAPRYTDVAPPGTGYLRTFKDFVLDRADARLFAVALDSWELTSPEHLLVLDERTATVERRLALGHVVDYRLVPTAHLLVLLTANEATGVLAVLALDTRTLQVRFSTPIATPAQDGWGYTPDRYCGGVVGGSCPPQVLAVDAASGTIAALVEFGAASPNALVVLDLRTGQIRRRMAVAAQAYTLALDGPLQRAYVVAPLTDLAQVLGTVTVLDLRSGATVATLRGMREPVSVAVDVADHTVFVPEMYSNGLVAMFDARISGDHNLGK